MPALNELEGKRISTTEAYEIARSLGYKGTLESLRQSGSRRNLRPYGLIRVPRDKVGHSSDSKNWIAIFPEPKGNWLLCQNCGLETKHYSKGDDRFQCLDCGATLKL